MFVCVFMILSYYCIAPNFRGAKFFLHFSRIELQPRKFECENFCVIIMHIRCDIYGICENCFHEIYKSANPQKFYSSKFYSVQYGIIINTINVLIEDKSVVVFYDTFI